MPNKSKEYTFQVRTPEHKGRSATSFPIRGRYAFITHRGELLVCDQEPNYMNHIIAAIAPGGWASVERVHEDA